MSSSVDKKKLLSDQAEKINNFIVCESDENYDADEEYVEITKGLEYQGSDQVNVNATDTNSLRQESTDSSLLLHKNEMAREVMVGSIGSKKRDGELYQSVDCITEYSDSTPSLSTAKHEPKYALSITVIIFLLTDKN